MSNAQICHERINSFVFSPIEGSNDLQLSVNSECCEVHTFESYTLNSNGTDHTINLCYRNTGLLMPTNITIPIILTGLNSGGNQSFTINSNIYFGPASSPQLCSSGRVFSSPYTLSLTTPLTQDRTFFLSNSEFSVKKTRLFPNPNSGNFSIQLSSENEQAAVTVSDLSGKRIYTTDSYFSGNPIELKGLAKGLYLVKVLQNQTTETLKFLVQ